MTTFCGSLNSELHFATDITIKRGHRLIRYGNWFAMGQGEAMETQYHLEQLLPQPKSQGPESSASCGLAARAWPALPQGQGEATNSVGICGVEHGDR